MIDATHPNVYFSLIQIFRILTTPGSKVGLLVNYGHCGFSVTQMLRDYTYH